MTSRHASFEPNEQNIPAARRFVTDLLRSEDVDPATVDWAALVTSELATTAVVHARTPFEVTVETNGEVVVSVVDSNPALPAVGVPDASSPGGRGIFIVSRSSDDWGVESLDGSKRVWCSCARHR